MKPRMNEFVSSGALPMVVSLVAAIMTMAASPAGALEAEVSDAADIDWANERLGVRELMRLEMQQMLAQEAHQRQGWSAPDTSPESGHGLQERQPVLTAIYGVGHQLTAEVRWGESVLHFRRGQRHHRDTGTQQLAYVLQAFAPPCVALDEAGTSRWLCLNQAHTRAPHASEGRP